MNTNHAYVHRRPKAEGGDLWGNWVLDEELRAFPRLVPLVEALRAEEGTDLPGGIGWSALFFFDYARDRPVIIALEMKSPDGSLAVPSLALDPDRPPSLEDVLRHVRERAAPPLPEAGEASSEAWTDDDWPDRI